MPRVPKIGKWLPPNTFCACLGRPPCLRGGIDDTRVTRRCLAWETPARYSDVDDHADLMAPVSLHDARLVKGDGLDDGPRPVATSVERLTVEDAVGERVACREDRDAAGDEALDLVHVEALVDPVDEQALGRVGLRADLTVLALVDLVGRDDQREDAERRLGEGLRPRRTPRADGGLRPGGARRRPPSASDPTRTEA